MKEKRKGCGSCCALFAGSLPQLFCVQDLGSRADWAGLLHKPGAAPTRIVIAPSRKIRKGSSRVLPLAKYRLNYPHPFAKQNISRVVHSFHF